MSVVEEVEDGFDYILDRLFALEKRVDEGVRLLWATVTSTKPLMVQIDGDPAPLIGTPGNAAAKILLPGERVQVAVQNSRARVLAVANRNEPLSGTTAQRLALGVSGAAVPGLKFYDTDENLDYVWRNGSWAPHGKLLWSGVWYVNASQIGVFSERISDQPNGAIFCFNEYPGSATNYNWIYHVVPKEHVARSSGQGITFLTSIGGTPTMSRKYIYVADDQFQGQAANASAPNNQHVLREVRSF